MVKGIVEDGAGQGRACVCVLPATVAGCMGRVEGGG